MELDVRLRSERVRSREDYAINFEIGHEAASPDDLIPGTFKLKKNMRNDYLIDRQVQKTQTYTGIDGINTQDMALQEGMGPICDRSKEHLGTTDRAIIVTRQLLLEACDTVEAKRQLARPIPKTYRTVRAVDSARSQRDRLARIVKEELVARF